ETAARELPERLQNNSGLLSGLRFGKVILDLVLVVFLVYWTWVPEWYHALLILLVVSFTHQLTEWLISAIVNNVRHRVRQQREAILTEQLLAPFTAYLTDAPQRSGSSLEQLQKVIVRVPATIRTLETQLFPERSAPLPPAGES
ncbi:MAG: hypothetical protein ACRCZF_11610, partial [Gemmataceae bacterium]